MRNFVVYEWVDWNGRTRVDMKQVCWVHNVWFRSW